MLVVDIQAKTPERGRGPNPQSSGQEAIVLRKLRCCLRSSTVSRRGPFCSWVLRRLTRIPVVRSAVSPSLDRRRCWMTHRMAQLRPSWQRPGRPGSATAGAWWTSPWCWRCGTAVCAARRPPPSSGPTSALGRRQRPSAHRAEQDRSDRRGRGGVHHRPGHYRPGRRSRFGDHEAGAVAGIEAWGLMLITYKAAYIFPIQRSHSASDAGNHLFLSDGPGGYKGGKRSSSGTNTGALTPVVSI